MMFRYSRRAALQARAPVIYRVVMMKHGCHRPACLSMSGLYLGVVATGRAVNNMSANAWKT